MTKKFQQNGSDVLNPGKKNPHYQYRLWSMKEVEQLIREEYSWFAPTFTGKWKQIEIVTIWTDHFNVIYTLNISPKFSTIQGCVGKETKRMECITPSLPDTDLIEFSSVTVFNIYLFLEKL